MLRTSEIVPPDQVSISIDALITMKINAGRWAVHFCYKQFYHQVGVVVSDAHVMSK